MATFVLEDLQSSIEVFVFPRTMTEVGHLLADDVVVCVKGRLDLRDEVPKLVCSGAQAAPARPSTAPNRCRSCCPSTALDDARVDRLRELLTRAPRAVAGLPACGHQGGAPGSGVQRDAQPRLAGRAAGTARTCLFVERRRLERLNLNLVPS